MSDGDTYFCRSCKAVIDQSECPHCDDGGDTVGPLDDDQLP